MFKLQAYFLFISLALLVSIVVGSQVPVNCDSKNNCEPKINCDILRNCNLKLNDPVNAATKGKNDCRVFRNECFYQEEYCNLRRDGKPLIRKITRKQCLASMTCKGACLAIYTPVCAEFLGYIKTFGNDCDAEAKSCRDNEGWVIIKNGECKNIKSGDHGFEEIQ